MRINEIFYSLQGEGHNTGRPAVFIRFAGCNIACAFCDTNHHAFTEMSEEDIVNAARQHKATFAVLTGGEPSLQVTPTLIDKLHAAGFTVAIETNGTHAIPTAIDWVTLSPKAGAPVVITHCDELKVIFTGEEDVHEPQEITATYHYLQPCDTGNSEANAAILTATIRYILNHPTWRLSLQTHKFLGIK